MATRHPARMLPSGARGGEEVNNGRAAETRHKRLKAFGFAEARSARNWGFAQP